MKLIILNFISALMCCFGSCQTGHMCTIALKSNYKGWIYLLKSTDTLKTSRLYPDSSGVIYIPEKIYNSDYSFIVDVDGTIPKLQEYQFYYAEFDDESGRRTSYCKFYFPPTTHGLSEKIYKFGDKKLPEFEYLYYSHKIDEHRLFRGDLLK